MSAWVGLKDEVAPWKAGTQPVPFPPPTGRYDQHLLEFGKIVRGEMENPYSLTYECLAQEVLLLGCGYQLDPDIL